MDHTPYSFLVSVNNPVPVPDPAQAHLPPDAEMTSTIRLSTPRRPEDTPLARVFTPRSAQRLGLQVPAPFWIHCGPDSRLWCSVRSVAPDVYDVCTADGAPLATITRRAAGLLPWPRRARWSALITNAPRPVTGKVGTWYAWLIYVATAPVWLLFALCVMVYSFFDGTPDDHTFKSPCRTRWRAPGTGTALDYRGISKTYRLDPQRLDTRVAYALAVVQTWERAGRAEQKVG
ncbi:hypothetical protein ACFWFI_03845 [Streptomyces sp. NPDC060209]|uniref:hypothetical protein n=1 Tax=Streptomyces sp. NPDC060209 TaxID=3347073 RepID=UPI00364EF187